MPQTPWETAAATPADIPGLIAVFRSGFQTERVHSVFPVTEAGNGWLARHFAAGIAPPPPAGAPVETALRVVRDPDGTPVAFAIFRIVAAGAGAHARGWQGRWSSVAGVEGMSEEKFEWFFGPQDRAREYLMGERAYLILDSLATLESHRKRGFGSALVQWGNDYADARGLECYLQASPLGYPVYERVGYRKHDVSAVVGDKEPWVAMVRPAKGAEEAE